MAMLLDDTARGASGTYEDRAVSRQRRRPVTCDTIRARALQGRATP